VTGAKEEVAMQARRDHTLKVIKGAKPGVPGRASRRRVVPRQLPASVAPIEELLERLDREPADDPAEVDDPAEFEDPAGGDDPASGDGPPQGAGDAPAGRRRLLVGLLVAVLAATLAAAGTTGHRWYVHQATDQARQEALAAAKQASVNFVSVSAASVDRDTQRITAGATGDFKEEFVRGQSQVRTAVVENKVDSRGSVLRAGLVSGDRRRAVVLVAVDATVKNVKAPEGRLSHYRIQLDLVRDQDSGRWLVSRLQFVG
jgi:Mce-associated membrane protein